MPDYNLENATRQPAIQVAVNIHPFRYMKVVEVIQNAISCRKFPNGTFNRAPRTQA
jgi:hypothetical protein